MTSATQRPGSKDEQMEREAREHIALGELLQKKRSSIGKRAVESILRQPMSVRQKIERVRLVDEEERRRAQGPAVTARHAAEESREEAGEAEARAARRRGRASYRRHVKEPLEPSGYLSFLLGGYRRIVDYGYASGMVEGLFLPPRVRLSRSVGPAFQSSVVPLAVQMLALCEQALKTGWLHVCKLDFNLIVLCSDLCEEVLARQRDSWSPRDRNLLARIRRLEASFLAFHYRPEYVGRLVKALTEALRKEGYPPERLEQLPTLVHGLLTDLNRTSLQGLVLALNMVKYRRYLTLADLLRKDAPEPLRSDEFDADDEVKQAIDQYMSATLDRLAALRRRREEIARVRRYLPPGSEAGGAPVALEAFYAWGEGERKNPFSEDAPNAIVLTVRLARKYLVAFGNLLGGRLAVEGGEHVQVFGGTVFGTPLSRLQNQLERAVRISYMLPSLPRDRLRQLRGKTGSLGRSEADMHQIHAELMDTLYEVSERLAAIQRADAASAPGEADGPAVAAELSDVEREGFVLPHRRRLIGDPTLERGRSVAEATEHAATIGYQIVLYFGDRRLTDLLQDEERIDKETSTLLARLERIADPATFGEARSSCGV